MKHFFSLWAIVGWLLLLPALAWADCTTPRIIRSAQDGNFNTASTWVGGVVPTICDYVIVDHAVALDVDYTIGQNGNGGLVINNGAALTGTARTVTVNSGYALTNNGTLTISKVALNSGSATFVNNNQATLGAAQFWDNGSQVINSGLLTVNNDVTQNNGRFNNVAIYGLLKVSGAIKLQGASVWDNVGRIVSTSATTDKAFYLEGVNSAFYNRPSGRFLMKTGGLWLTSNTFVYNENFMTVLNWESHDDQNGLVQNTDSIAVLGNMINGSPFNNLAGGYISIGGNLSQISKTNSILYTDGYVRVAGNFSNDKRIGGGAGGGFYVAGSSVNTSNGLVQGSVDFCDPSVTGTHTIGGTAYPNIFDSNANSNSGTNFGVSTTVTRCGYVAPTAALKPAVVSGPASMCPGSTGNVFSIPAVSGATGYVWSVSSGTITSGAGSTSITVTAGSAATVVSVRVTGSGSDYAATSKLVQTSASAPAQPTTIVGPSSTLCPATQGYSFTTTAVTGASSYIWTVPSGWTINYGQGTTSISVTSGATAGSVTVTAINACGSSTARTLAVTPPSTLAATSFVNPNTAFCTNQNPNYTVTSVPGAIGYKWTVTGITGASVDPNNAITPGVYGTTKQVIFPNPGTATITVTPVNACGDGPSTSVTVTVTNGGLSNPTFVASSGQINKAAPCANVAGSVYQINAVTNAASYTWTVPTGWVITAPSGATGTSFTTTSTSITVTPGTTGGSVQVQASNTCSGSTSASFAVAPPTPPAQPGTISGPAAYCPGTGAVYSATSTSASVSWSFPTGWVLTNPTYSGGVAGITATPGTDALDGTISVVTLSAGGCPGPARTLAVASSSPNPGPVSGTSAVKTGQSYTYSIAGTSATSYTWTVPTGWVITAPLGATGTSFTTTSTSITVTAGATSGTVGVTALKGGCTSTAATRAVLADQPTTYSATNYGSSKKNTCYTTGQSLLQAADGNGGIVSAAVVSGALPTGVALSATTGELTVADASALPATSTTAFTIRATDAQGGQTDVPVTLTFTADRAPSVTTAQARTLESYTNGQVLATYSDLDGSITSTTLASGTLPPGTTLTASGGVGQLLVADRNKLSPGTYTFTVRCTDDNCTVGVGLVATSLTIGNSQTLPVTLTTFAALRTAERQVSLTWATAQETNSAYFAVERSPDARSFVEIARLSAQGTSTQAHRYAYTDAPAPTGQLYYRLRQVDQDGTTAYSTVRVVAATGAAPVRLQATAAPNPTPGSFTVELNATPTAAVRVSIVSALGTVVATRTFAAGQPLTFDLGNQPSGLYLLRVQAGEQQTVLRVVKN